MQNVDIFCFVVLKAFLGFKIGLYNGTAIVWGRSYLAAWTKRNARSEDKRNGPCAPGPSWSAMPAAACVRMGVECVVSWLPLAATDAGAAGRVQRQCPADSVG